MDKQNDMAQLRYLEEIAISLKRAGYDIGRIEDRHLPVSWNGGYLCRISSKSRVLYRQRMWTQRRTGKTVKCNRHRKNDLRVHGNDGTNAAAQGKKSGGDYRLLFKNVIYNFHLELLFV